MPKTVRAVTTNAGVVAWYRARLRRELKAMHKSISYWIEAAYKAQEAEIVGDASPTTELLARFNALSHSWLKRWNVMGDWLARRAIDKTKKTTTVSMKEAFKAAGFTVKFDANKELDDISRALIKANVNLIKNKYVRPYLAEVETIILQGVTMGRNLGYIREELAKRYEITYKRAALIARDQLDKATQAIQRTNDAKIGITEGIWVHMPGQYSSRSTHKSKAMNGKRFKLSEGLYDPDPKVDRKILPGELVCCRCTYRRVLPDLEFKK